MESHTREGINTPEKRKIQNKIYPKQNLSKTKFWKKVWRVKLLV
jgi:hypothetical protein